MTTVSSILPHVLLPLLLPLSTLPPPFPGRAYLCLAIYLILQFLCTTSPWPSNAVTDPDARSMRYGMATSWIFILPWLQRVVLGAVLDDGNVPERVIWEVGSQAGEGRDGGGDGKAEKRDDEGERKVVQCGKDWSWQKLCWSARLTASPRAVGWNIGSKTVNTWRAETKSQRLRGLLTRHGFILQRLAKAALCYLAWDVVMVALREMNTAGGGMIPAPGDVLARESWGMQEIKRILLLEVLMILTVCCGMTMQFELAAAVAVGLRVTDPEDWPPLFGSILDCYTVANLWGRFWHQYLRQVSTTSDSRSSSKQRQSLTQHSPVLESANPSSPPYASPAALISHTPSTLSLRLASAPCVISLPLAPSVLGISR